jgi:hypothetical protein
MLLRPKAGPTPLSSASAFLCAAVHVHHVGQRLAVAAHRIRAHPVLKWFYQLEQAT